MITRTVFRILWVVVSFLFASGIALAVLLLLGALWVGDELRQAAPHDSMMQQGGEVFGLVMFTAAIAPTLTVLPALIAVVIGEVLKFRSWMYYVIAGGISLLAVPLLVGTPGELSTLPPPQATAIFATAGFTGGFVYWLICGRGA
ncbi:hypothetical protein A7A08_01243 [Methyloligella halotolerans]|uniref:Uncharacterized protein n=1 Tax=Methyloligella halotolerans TaxID=1177755 RepID=A0A1E2S0P0_9HYPH|nr:hypothetical protein [Methyloligella halotolerans]ODA68073.1 hypothetical protein A7A08_01243 [Methyloligella halotolerans]